MKYRQLGDTELRISEVSFGTWAIGGGWGEANDDESIRGLHRAMEAGVNFLIQRMYMARVMPKSSLRKRRKGKKMRYTLPRSFAVRVIFMTLRLTRSKRFANLRKTA